MSKAILILDKMPETCTDCPLKGFYQCWRPAKINKPCPLKPLPQHKITDLEKTTDYSCGWEQGYNACLDEILGGRK